MQFWNDFEGEVVGGFALRKLIRSEGRNAWFETEADGSKALLSVTESLNDDQAIVERLEAARGLSHENLLRVRQVGRAELKDTPLVYALMDPVEENLGDVLRDRALGTAETEMITRSLLNALMELHRNGLVHGRVEPASVLAVGDTIKMRSDCVQLARRAAQNGHDWTGIDFRGLGATLCQCLTQRAPRSAEDEQIKALPAPYSAIVANSLEGNWTSAEILRALENPSYGTVAAPVAAASAAPARTAPERSLLLDDDEPEPRSGLPRRTPLYAGIAVVVLLLIVWLVIRSKSPSHPSSASSSPAAASAAGSSAASGAANPAASAGAVGAPAASPGKARAGKPLAPGAKVVVPLSASPARAATTPAQAATTPVPSGQGGAWHVVAYTYNRQDQAQHKADELNAKHPGLGASVFHPESRHSAYLVAIGGGMDREAAYRLRDKLRRSGLPRDTFAQNFR
jgi:hypothetical protein